MHRSPAPHSARPAKRACACLLAAALAWAQAPAPAPPAPATPAPVQVDGALALRHLNLAVAWYRHVTTDIQALGLPSEVIYQDQAQAQGVQVVRLAFQSCRSEAELIQAREAGAAGPASGGTGQAQRRAQAEARIAALVKDLQAQVAALEATRDGTPAARRTGLEIRLERLRSQLELQQALLDAIRRMEAFARNSGEAAGGLAGSIEQLARSVPEVLGQAAEPAKAGGTAPQRPSFSSSGGLISQVATLYDCMNAERQIEAIIQRTDRLRSLADQVRTPLRTELRATIQEGQAPAGQQAPAEEDAAALQAETRAARALTERFKQLSAALMPLSQELMLLDDSTANLGRWRDLVKRASGFVLRAVLIRVGVMLLALGLVLALSEAWRRVTFRYVKEQRRRRQFLVLRRVVAGFLITIVLVLGFVTEFSSLATFAGFITAGIAVGLQAVLLSVAAYFLIIGRYGIRVGDRISIAGITGDVVDVGLVRFYLMELAGTGLDFQPTGRIVVFSNAVLFQASTPLFKQVPGAEYVWHEVVLALAPGGDHRPVQAKFLAAVEGAYAEHGLELEKQHQALERQGEIQVEAPRPEARLQFAEAGLELLVRYPVAIHRAKAMDEQVTQRVLELLAGDPELKAAVPGPPRLRSLLKG